MSTIDTPRPPAVPERLASAPRVAFLGVCRAAQVDGEAPLTTTSLFGLSHVVTSYAFPLPIAGTILVFAVYDLPTMAPAVIQLLNPEGEGILRIDLTPGPPVPVDDFTNRGWTILYSRPNLDQMIVAPGVHPVVLGEDSDARRIGDVVFACVDPPPLTSEQIETLRLNPRALTGVQLKLHCKSCQDGVTVYAAIDRDPERESRGVRWYQDLPDAFACTCGKTRFDLTYLRRNLHGYIGMEGRAVPWGAVEVEALRRQAALRSMCMELLALLEREASEEEVHQFIDKNRVFLHVFAPVRVWSKPPITTKYRADFAILTSSKELLLVELERPGTVLMTKDGGMSAKLQAPFNQVRNWLTAVADHRAAVLDGLEAPRDVGAIRAVVIAGRSHRLEEAEQLRALKMHVSTDTIRFMTYDDLLVAMVTLTMSLAKAEPFLHSPDADLAP